MTDFVYQGALSNVTKVSGIALALFLAINCKDSSILSWILTQRSQTFIYSRPMYIKFIHMLVPAQTPKVSQIYPLLAGLMLSVCSVLPKK